jgi:hypothetical protein
MNDRGPEVGVHSDADGMDAAAMPTLDETRGNGWVAYTFGELRQMWFPPPTAGRRWLYRDADGALFWVLPDVDDGVMVSAIQPAEAAAEAA